MRLWTCGLVVEVGQVEQLAPFRRVIRAAAAQCAEPCGPESGQAERRGECCGVDSGALVEHARGAQGGQSPDPSRAAGGDRRGTHGGVTGGAAGAVRARSAPEGAGTLERVAQYAFGSVVEGRIDVSYAYPRFGSGAGALNELLERGAELGRFKLGSTAIVLCADNMQSWRPDLTCGSSLQMGQQIGTMGS